MHSKPLFAVLQHVWTGTEIQTSLGPISYRMDWLQMFSCKLHLASCKSIHLQNTSFHLLCLKPKLKRLFNFFLLTLTYLQLCKQNPIWFFKAQRGKQLSLDKCNQVGAVIFLFTSAAANSNVRGAIKQKPAIFQRSLTYFTIFLGQVRHELIQWQVSQWRVRQELLN